MKNDNPNTTLGYFTLNTHTIYVKKRSFPEPNKAIASALALGFLIFIPHTFFYVSYDFY